MPMGVQEVQSPLHAIRCISRRPPLFWHKSAVSPLLSNGSLNRERFLPCLSTIQAPGSSCLAVLFWISFTPSRSAQKPKNCSLVILLKSSAWEPLTAKVGWRHVTTFFQSVNCLAFMSPGNEFSSLNGLLFQWHFGDMPKEDEAIVRWVKYADSSYDASNPSITVLEAKGRKGHSILIEALRTGSTKVTASLESDSSRVIPAVNRIYVIANCCLRFLLP